MSSSLSLGIVGLPNVGKSTLFNALTKLSVDAENYPFCTIEPNSGIVAVPDYRLGVLSEISGTTNLIYSTVEFVDIAGLIKGASKGEGLGNQFLTNIRDTSAIVHVVRCFQDDNVIHVNQKVNPLEDIETINLELMISDLDRATKISETLVRKAKTNNKEDKLKLDLIQRIIAQLEKSQPVRSLDFTEEEQRLLKEFAFITSKKVIYVGNIGENDLPGPNELALQVKAFAESHGDGFLCLSAKIESELASLSPEDYAELLSEYGLQESGLDRLIKASFSLLNLQTYLTTGAKETRAWTIPVGATAPQAAGKIHSDFEKGFIRANIVKYDDFVANKGLKGCKEKGLVRQEGKDYIMQENDIVEFLFNV